MENLQEYQRLQSKNTDFYAELSKLCEKCLKGIENNSVKDIITYARCINKVLPQISSKIFGKQAFHIFKSVSEYYFSIENYKKSVLFTKSALSLSHFFENPNSIIKVLILKAKCEYKLQDFRKSVKTLIKAIDLYKKTLDDFKTYDKNLADMEKSKINDFFCIGKKAEDDKNYFVAYDAYNNLCEYFKCLIKKRKKYALTSYSRIKIETKIQENIHSTSLRISKKEAVKSIGNPKSSSVYPSNNSATNNLKYFYYNLKPNSNCEKTNNRRIRNEISKQRATTLISASKTPDIFRNKNSKSPLTKKPNYNKNKETDKEIHVNEMIKQTKKITLEVPRFRFDWKKRAYKTDNDKQIRDDKTKNAAESKKNDLIKKCIKIQAFVRKFIHKEKYKIMKSGKRPLKIAARFINDVIYHLKIYENEFTYKINASNDMYSYTIDVSKEKSLSSIVPGLFINSMGLISYSDTIQNLSNNFKPIKTHYCSLENEKIPIRFSINNRTNTLKLDFSHNGSALSTILSNKIVSGITSLLSNDTQHLTLSPKNKISENLLHHYIDHCIVNYLKISSNLIYVNYPKAFTEKEFLYKIFMKISKIKYQITLYKLLTQSSKEMEIFVENLNNNTRFFNFFPWEICEKHLKSVKEFEDDYFLIILALEILENSIAIKNVRKDFKFIGSTKKQIGKNDYLLRIFEYKTNKFQYLFEGINYDMSQVASIVESQGKIKKKFGLAKKKIKDNYDKLLDNIRIKDEKLCFIDIQKKNNIKINPSTTMISSIMKLQNIFRAKVYQDQLKLMNTEGKSFLYSENKLINKTQYLISLFKIGSNILIQAHNKISKETVYKHIKTPTKYVSRLKKFSDLPKIIQAIRVYHNKLVITRSKPNFKKSDPSNSYFTEGPFIYTSINKESNWPILLQKDLNTCEYIIYGNLDNDKSLIATLISLDKTQPSYTRIFTPADIIKIIGINDPKSLLDTLRISYGHVVTSDVFTLSVPVKLGISYGHVVTSDVFTLSVPVNVEEFLGLKVIYKTCVKISVYMFVLCASFNENFEEYEESEFHFFARLTSSLEKCRKASIKLGLASEKSRIAKSYPVAIAEYIARFMIVLTLDEFYIDCSRPTVDFNQFALKIQSLIRGYKVRKLLCIKLDFIFHEYFRVSETTFCFMIYSYKKSYFLTAIKGLICYKIQLSHNFVKRFFEAGLKKQFFLKEIVTNITYDENTMTFNDKNIQRNNLHKQTILDSDPIELTPVIINNFDNNEKRLNSNEELVTTMKITPNFIPYSISIYKGLKKYCIEVASLEGKAVSVKYIKNNSIDFEALCKKIHIDSNRGKIYIEKRSLFNEICMITQKKTSLIIYEHKNGFYLDAYIFDSRKPYHLFLGESIRVHSILSKLKISTDGKNDKLVLSDY
ncbi:hypothetical protein SteCoe_9846 [Stentor coeruleus]|uniref:Uncharacterized protein n=1 Tax=Stentor coeruleus TaxID=5963 RepID=A0A1R2CH15_9CILI|nr:hypothetical protein SteCoe_9846 [Stentor coeruleus]